MEPDHTAARAEARRLFPLFLLGVGLIALACSLGCATPTEGYAIGRKFQGGAAETLTATYDGWRAWDLKYQTIVAETSPTKLEMRATLADYRKRVQSTVDKGFDVAKEAIRQLRNALDAADAIKVGSFAGAIATVAKALFEIGELFVRFNIGVPAPKVAP